jgi:ribulose-5-phosphate 4-epimerase/fuculose-1-phosphate aldolase
MCFNLLSQNHGLLTVSNSIEAAVHYFIQLENACQYQMLADTAAAARGTTTIKINPKQAEITGKTLGDATNVGWFSGLIEFDLLEAQEGKKFDFTK